MQAYNDILRIPRMSDVFDAYEMKSRCDGKNVRLQAYYYRHNMHKSAENVPSECIEGVCTAVCTAKKLKSNQNG